MVWKNIFLGKKITNNKQAKKKLQDSLLNYGKQIISIQLIKKKKKENVTPKRKEKKCRRVEMMKYGKLCQ